MISDPKNNDDFKQHLLKIEARLDQIAVSQNWHFDSALRTDEVELRELFMAFIFTLGSAIYAIMQPNIYKADALLAPAESSGGGGLSRIAGQLGGLASLAGVNLSNGESSQTELAAQVIRSRQFVDSFIQKHDLLVPLMAVKRWDVGANRLVLDDKIYNEKTNTWISETESSGEAVPTAQQAYHVFVKKNLSFSQDKETGLYTLAISHYSPYIAQQWVEWLIADINEVMRERTINEATQNLEYLKTQLQKTAIADMQATFFKLIEEQTKSLMLAEVQEEFVFKVVDPAVIPEIKESPKRALICVIGILLGGILSCGLVLVIFAFRNGA
jgi:uncharacterized protein involved in exopolysaccharide biosynthesis